MEINDLNELYSSLSELRKEKLINKRFTIKELMLIEQKNLFSISSKPNCIPLHLKNILNVIIKNCVSTSEDYIIDTIDKIFLLRELRDITIGKTVNKYIDYDTKVSFKLNKLDYKFINKIEKEKILKINDNLEIILKFPSLEKDEVYNNVLINVINDIIETCDINKEAIDDSLITSAQWESEILRVIKQITFKNIEYKFDELQYEDQKRIISMLNNEILDKIISFNKQLVELWEHCFTITNDEYEIEDIINLDIYLFSKDN